MAVTGPDPQSVSVIEEPDTGVPATPIAAVAKGRSVVDFGTYSRAYWARVKGGDSGMLPVIAGLILIAIVFELLNGKFLTAQNLMNWLQQSSLYMVFGMGVIFVLLLGEIDLSIGWVGLTASAITAQMLAANHSLGVTMVVALGVSAIIGLANGLLITLLGLPSFVVTLAGFLAYEGVVLVILGNGGTVRITDNYFNDIAIGYITNLAVTWIIVGIVVVVAAFVVWRRDNRRRDSGLVAPPVALTAIKIGAIAAGGILLALLVNANRGTLAIVPIKGLPIYILEVGGVFLIWSVLLNRTKPGRYIYAIGGNREAARRAGVNTNAIRTMCFTLSSLNAGMAGILIAGQFQSASTSVDGGQLTLYSIAAAVIGGTSLFGGRGKAIYGIVGGLVIAGIVNGMALLEVSSYMEYVMTGLILLVAVAIDALTHRRAVAV